MIFLSILVGFASGLAAVAIKYSVHGISSLLHKGIGEDYFNLIYMAYPVVGIAIAVIFMRYIIRRKVEHGIPGVLYSIAKNKAYIRVHNLFSSVITSAFTVGFGGSVGLEGPTVATGAAAGSNMGRLFHLSYKQRILLLGAAASGAMASIFKAPVAAIVFVIEVIMIDLTMASIVPLLLASVSGALTSYLFLGPDVIYKFVPDKLHVLSEVKYFILLGAFSGLLSVYSTKVYLFIDKQFQKIKKNRYRLIFGGFLLGVLIFLIPSLYGEGYDAINSCLKGDFSYLFDSSLFYNHRDNFYIAIFLLLMAVLLKIVASSLTFSAGGVGGIFAPTLFMGANYGLLFALLINFFNLGEISTVNYALAGMAGMIAGVLQAPLTAIFLIAEITGGYTLLIPLMITATISYALSRTMTPNSVYTIQLAKRGTLLTHHTDKNMLALMQMQKVLETDFSPIHVSGNLGDLVKLIAKSKRDLYPVINDDNYFLGLINLNRVRDIMFDKSKYKKVMIKDLMFTPPITVDITENMESVAQKLQIINAYNLVVLEHGKYRGFVSRARVFNAYRHLLKQFSEH
jgi:CIC family chloride channel protein